MPRYFQCEFHYYTQGISLEISLLCLGAFIGNFIIITQGISLAISLLCLGTFNVNFIIMPGHFHCNFIIIPPSKQMTTMPHVAVVALAVMGSISPGFPIRQAVPLELPQSSGSGSLLGSLGSDFHGNNNVYW